jgi:hypothetical protein
MRPAVADVYLDACCFIYLVEGWTGDASLARCVEVPVVVISASTP